MIHLLFLVCVVAVKVFKKTTPNGKVTVYLGKRDFIDHLDYVDPIDGVVVVESDYLKGRKIFGQLTTTYRYGREEDEVMGLKFSKEMILAKDQIVPSVTDKSGLTAVQERLVKKFGVNAFPFTYRFPGGLDEEKNDGLIRGVRDLQHETDCNGFLLSCCLTTRKASFKKSGKKPDLQIVKKALDNSIKKETLLTGMLECFQ